MLPDIIKCPAGHFFFFQQDFKRNSWNMNEEGGGGLMRIESLDESYHVNMLIELLMRYPEIYTITFNVTSSSCSLSYMINRQLQRDELADLKQKLKLSLQVFYFLHDYDDTVDFKIRKSRCYGMDRIQITLEANALLGEAISLLTKTMYEIFQEDLVGEIRPRNVGYLPEIAASLEELPGRPHSAEASRKIGHLFAFRDAGKVYIYDK